MVKKTRRKRSRKRRGGDGKKEYKIVNAYGTFFDECHQLLEKKVNDALKIPGWELLGGVSMCVKNNDFVASQALVKSEE